jgi:hypothetical protein
LLLCDAGPEGAAWTVGDVAAALGITLRTIEHLKQRFVEQGIEAALQSKLRSWPGKATATGARKNLIGSSQRWTPESS